MAAAHCIKVMLFHHDQIFLCLSNIDNRTRHRIAVMTVYALDYVRSFECPPLDN